jgi:hypothetical protein
MPSSPLTYLRFRGYCIGFNDDALISNTTPLSSPSASPSSSPAAAVVSPYEAAMTSALATAPAVTDASIAARIDQSNTDSGKGLRFLDGVAYVG